MGAKKSTKKKATTKSALDYNEHKLEQRLQRELRFLDSIGGSARAKQAVQAALDKLK